MKRRPRYNPIDLAAPTLDELRRDLLRPPGRDPRVVRAARAAVRDLAIETPRQRAAGRPPPSAFELLGGGALTEALERLVVRGLLPEEWASHPPFRVALHLGAKGGPRMGDPLDANALAVVAADWRGVEACYALAGEAVARFAPWSREPTRAEDLVPALSVADRPRMFVTLDYAGVGEAIPAAAREGGAWILGDVLAATYNAMTRASFNIYTAFGKSELAKKLPPLVILLHRYTEAWTLLAGLGAEVPTTLPNVEVPSSLRGVPLARLRNPFAPLVAIYARGYSVRFASTAVWIDTPLPSVKLR